MIDYNQKDYEKDVIDIDSIDMNNIKINPDFYIHTALLKAQGCLIKDNYQEGFLQYVAIIDHIEILCRSAHMLPDDYNQQISDFKQTDKYIKENQNILKGVLLAGKKLELFMSVVFQSKTSIGALKA